MRKCIGNKNIITNIYRKQAYDSIMFGYFYTRFSDFMLKGKSLLEYTIWFSPIDCEKNDKIIKNPFCERIFKKLGWEKPIVLSVESVKNLKSLKYHIFLVFVTNVRKKNKLKYQKFLV